MPTKRYKVRFANGRITTLTTGELNAIESFGLANGTDPESTQFDPGGVHYTTVLSLVSKGVFVRQADSMPRFAPGLLPVVPPETKGFMRPLFEDVQVSA